ncbi:scamp-domain-containing protein [Rickenella mellea]|uniref:Scamp-domain-containing protein n=1 Tax=Rickenella mellea TaxID=50990 RepID=A0A4Y7QD31_9AGAM|nr:scamp-domain-containing protein [Rickenella mellea]
MSQLHENPFSSTHSLDTNPFDDPTPGRTTSNVFGDAGRAEAQNIEQRQQELIQREQQLAAREAELNRKAEHIRVHGRNNWPPFYPLIFHSIADEIPEDSKPLITRLYQLWLVLLGTLIVNVVACILILIAGSSDGGRDLGGSIGYVFFIGILSFLLWYRPIYNGYMKEQSLYYYFYFFFCGFHLLFSIYMIIGIPGTGSAGLIQTIQMYSRPAIPAAIVGTVATVGWTIQGVGNAFYYRQIWNHHNAAGHSITKAKTELATHGASAYFKRG